MDPERDGAEQQAPMGPLSAIERSFKQGKLAARIDRLVASRVDPSRTLVVSGYWRSGTTWLQESLARLLGAKTVFEPFHFLVPAGRALLSRNLPSGKGDSFIELHMPYCAGRALEGELRSVFESALRSTLSGRANRVLRSGWLESFRRRVVLKVVRGHLCLKAAQETFGMPVIHVYRDPRAIIASVKQTGWDWLFDHLSLKEQLLDPPDGRAELFGRWRDEIEQYDRMDPLARVTAYWAITERYLHDSFEATQRSATAREPLASAASAGAPWLFVSYEDLCQKRESFLVELVRKLGLQPARSRGASVLDQESFSTSERRRGASLDDRLMGWKKQLSTDEVACIERIVRRFALESRLQAAA